MSGEREPQTWITSDTCERGAEGRTTGRRDEILGKLSPGQWESPQEVSYQAGSRLP